MTNSQMFVKSDRGLQCLRSQNSGHRAHRREKHMKKASLESQNFRFYDHFAEAKLSYGMWAFLC